MFHLTDDARRHPATARMRALGIETVQELARRAETTQPTISAWLNKDRGLSRSVGFRVAKALDVSLETVLLQWTPPPKKKEQKPKRKRTRAA